ncbi:MAG: pilus assembly protein PilM [Pirellulales bacterium]
MVSQRLGWIGVDVGTHAVKLAQVVRDAGGVRLHRAAVMQRPTSWPTSDRLAFDQPVSSVVEIRAARQCGRFVGRNAVCSLPMNACQLRGLSVPPGENDERRSMIADELAAEWAEQRVAMEFDFWELETASPDKSSDGFNVNMLAIARPWILQLARDCRQAGLDCWVVDGAPLAMARAVALAGGLGGGQRALAVDWGYSNTTLCVVGDGRPWYTRRVSDCAFGQALEAIARRFDVALDQAQFLADTHGIPSPTAEGAGDRAAQAAIAEAVESTVDNLRDHARRTLHFLETQRRHLHPVAIWLMGGGASMRYIGPWLEEALHLPVHIWNLPYENESLSFAAGTRSALFAGAAALSALAWRAA